MKIDRRELEKPIMRKPDGTFATLKEMIKEPSRVAAVLGPVDYKDLAVARFEKMDPQKAIYVVGKGSFTKNQILMEIKRDTEVGRTFVKMQEKFIRYLLNRKEEINAD